jgi:hypothetical protein
LVSSGRAARRPGLAQSPHNAGRRSLEGEWHGTYSCTQGVTGVTLQVAPSMAANGVYTVTFAFYLPGSQTSGASGSYEGTLR